MQINFQHISLEFQRLGSFQRIQFLILLESNEYYM